MMRNECATCDRLLHRLNDRCFVTGTELGGELGISRAAVHKHIESLKASGLPVDAVSGRGYRLARGVAPMQASIISDYVSEPCGRLIRGITVERSIDSTNSRLLNSATHESIHGQVCVAEAQPAGRGRRGRRWIATPYRNLLMSIGWVYQEWPRDVTGLSIAVGISLIEALRTLGFKGLGMKWPNDIVHAGRKLGGILIEVSGESSGPCTIVVGIGINVHIGSAEVPLIDQPWTDLGGMRDGSVERNELAAALLSSLCDMLYRYPESGFEPWRGKWGAVDVLAGREVSILARQNDESTQGIAAGINSSGALLVDVTGSGTHSFLSGEVSVRAR